MLSITENGTRESKKEEDNMYINLNSCTSQKITLKDFNLLKLVGKG